MGMLLALVLLFELAKICDLVTLLVDDGVSIRILGLEPERERERCY